MVDREGSRYRTAERGTRVRADLPSMHGGVMPNVKQPVTDDSIKVRQLTHYQFQLGRR